MRKINLFILGALGALFAWSCSPPATPDRPAIRSDSAAVATDSAIPAPPSPNLPPPPPPEYTGDTGHLPAHLRGSRQPHIPSDASKSAKSATLGYSYCPTMARHDTKNINVFVDIKNPRSYIRDTLTRIIHEEEGTAGSTCDTVVIYPGNLWIYDSLEVKLIDPGGDMEVTPIHNSDAQWIDTVNGNLWRWSIRTGTDKKKVDLILKFNAITPAGAHAKLENGDIHIRVTVDPNWVRAFLDYLMDHPAQTIGYLAAIIGAIWFVIRLLLRRKKGDAGD